MTTTSVETAKRLLELHSEYVDRRQAERDDFLPGVGTISGRTPEQIAVEYAEVLDDLLR